MNEPRDAGTSGAPANTGGGVDVPKGNHSRKDAARQVRRLAQYGCYAERKQDPMARLGERVTRLPSGCWQYGDHLDEYGAFILGRQQYAHRVVYEILVGPIPEGFVIHHECEHRGCVNPQHLLALSPGDHMRRHAEMRKAS